MKEWLSTSPFSSVLGIIIVIAAVIIAFKVIKSIAKPLFLGILIVAGVLILFNVIDLAFIASTGQKLLGFIWDKITASAADAAAEALSATDLPSFR